MSSPDFDTAAAAADARAFTSLLDAAARGDEPAVVSALDRVPSLARRANTAGHTALLVASRAGRDNIVALLVERGADLAADDAHGLTALHHAVLAKSRRTVLALVANGAPLRALDAQGKSAHDLAVMLGVSDIAFVLRPK